VSALTDARDYLEKMKAHEHCCGTPVVRALVAEVELLERRAERAKGHIEGNAPNTAIAALDGSYDNDR
jgi:hypothetical protein